MTLVGGAAAASVSRPSTARAQKSDRMRRIGVLMGGRESDPEVQARVAVFHEGMRELGWTGDRNLRIDGRWAAGNVDLLKAYAADGGHDTRRDP
jgi:hypothetical protein